MDQAPHLTRIILIVDDYDELRAMMRSVFEMNGYDVVEAANGQEAVEIAFARRLDLILMDIDMPVLDGLSAAREIRHIFSREEVPIVAFSANEPSEYTPKALTAGCNEYLAKPFDLKELSVVLDRYIPKARVAAH